MCKKSQQRDNIMNPFLSIFSTFTYGQNFPNKDLPQIPAGQTDVIVKVNFLSLEHSPEGFGVCCDEGIDLAPNPQNLAFLVLVVVFASCSIPKCAMAPDHPGASTWSITPSWSTTKIKPTELSKKPSLHFFSLGVSKNIRMRIQRQSDKGPFPQKYQGMLLRSIRHRMTYVYSAFTQVSLKLE